MNGSNGNIAGLLERIIERLDTLTEGQDSLREGQDSLREGQNSLRDGQDSLREGQDSLREGQDSLRYEVRLGFKKVNARIDNMLTFTGAHHRDHERRIRSLERHASITPRPRRKG